MKEQNKHPLIALLAFMSVIIFYIANAYIEYRESVNQRKIVLKEKVAILKAENTRLEEEDAKIEAEIAFADSVKTLIAQLNIKHPDIVFWQAEIETGNFTSDIFKENKNLFGMREVKSRPTTQTGVNKYYGVYESWQMSVIDYALLQAWSCKRMNREQFIEYLRTSYASDSTYIDKLKIPPQ